MKRVALAGPVLLRPPLLLMHAVHVANRRASGIRWHDAVSLCDTKSVRRHLNNQYVPRSVILSNNSFRIESFCRGVTAWAGDVKQASLKLEGTR